MIFCILGCTGSGKDHVAKEVSKKLNLPIIVSHTTRPMRPKEKQGVEYYFIDKETFEKNINNMMAIREYKVWDGSIWKYGINKSEFIHDNCILIVDIDGYEEIRKHFGRDNVFAFLLHTTKENILSRINSRGDNEKEVLRRMEDDNKKIKNFLDNEWDYCTIDNNGPIEDAVSVIEKIIDYFYL